MKCLVNNLSKVTSVSHSIASLIDLDNIAWGMTWLNWSKGYLRSRNISSSLLPGLRKIWSLSESVLALIFDSSIFKYSILHILEQKFSVNGKAECLFYHCIKYKWRNVGSTLQVLILLSLQSYCEGLPLSNCNLQKKIDITHKSKKKDIYN